MRPAVYFPETYLLLIFDQHYCMEAIAAEQISILK